MLYIQSFLRSFRSEIIFISLFIIISAFYYDSVLDKGPLNAHVWRQTDCLSISHHYYAGSDFLQPEMHIQLADNFTSGKTAGEFPILYYIVGKIWQIFGYSYFAYRFFYLLILFCGLLAFYKTLKIIFHDNFWAILISLLLFTSPVYVVYGISFLTDAPAFSFVLMGGYFFTRYHLQRKTSNLFLTLFFFALGGLIKVSSLIAFLFLVLIFFLECLGIKSLGRKRLFSCNLKEGLGILFVFVVILSWYAYAHYYNSLHGFKYTFNNIFPLWQLKEGEFEVLLKNVLSFPRFVFFNDSMLYLLLIVSIGNLFLFRKHILLSYLANIVIITGSVIYFVLWAPLMGNHDYYYVALLVIFPGVLLPFLGLVKKEYPVVFNGIALKTLLSVFFVWNFLYCWNVVKLKTLSEKGNFYLVNNGAFVKAMFWENWNTRNNLKAFEELQSIIIKLGITKKDRVICLPDESFNSSLFLLGQKGWTNYLHYNKSKDIENLIHKGANYLFIADPKLLSEDYLAPFLKNNLGSYKGIEIFELDN